MKILLASFPADGHFNPLTGLAVHLRDRGHEVQWYTGPSYAERLRKLGIPHAPFVRAQDINGENISEFYPEYATLGAGPKAIAFALEKVFFGNLQAQLDDLVELRESFAFEAILFDAAFYAGRLVAEKCGVPAYPLWPAPTPAPVSKTAPPPMFGLRPMGGVFGKIRDAMVMKLLGSTTKNGMKIWHELREREGLPRWGGNPFDIHVDSSAAMFMVGTPGMDFPRDDWPSHLSFVGPLTARRSGAQPVAALPDALARRIDAHDGPVVVVAQGTIDNRDPEKLMAPTLAALAESRHLVIATTGGRHTDTLRERFTSDNLVVEDFVDYGALMPRTDLFVSNGGYGSVMQALVHGVPLVLAGKNEGKADINARMAYRGLGVDLRTERPTPARILRAVERVLGDPSFRDNVARVRAELSEYDSCRIVEERIVGAGRGVGAGRARVAATGSAP